MATAWPQNRNLGSAPHRQAGVAELVRKGPDHAADGVARRRRVDLPSSPARHGGTSARVIKPRFHVTLARRGAGAMPRQPGFGRLSVRPRHPRRDPPQRVHGWFRDKMPDQMQLPFAFWTARAARGLIHEKFGKTLGLSTMQLYLKRSSFAAQKPLTRTTPRDPLGIAAWRAQDYPRIVARAKREKAAIH
ncbi:MAG: winged helix-turn-helix domain-containing protein [Methylocella sp.]